MNTGMLLIVLVGAAAAFQGVRWFTRRRKNSVQALEANATRFYDLSRRVLGSDALNGETALSLHQMALSVKNPDRYAPIWSAVLWRSMTSFAREPRSTMHIPDEVSADFFTSTSDGLRLMAALSGRYGIVIRLWLWKHNVPTSSGTQRPTSKADLLQATQDFGASIDGGASNPI